MSNYIPGVCNIGQQEIKKRKFAGFLGSGLSGLLFVFLVLIRANTQWRLLLFFPVSLAAVGFLQAYFHFCAAFGLSGLYNMAKSVDQTDTVSQARFRAKDRQKALEIILLSVLTGLVAAWLATWLRV